MQVQKWRVVVVNFHSRDAERLSGRLKALTEEDRSSELVTFSRFSTTFIARAFSAISSKHVLQIANECSAARIRNRLTASQIQK